MLLSRVSRTDVISLPHVPHSWRHSRSRSHLYIPNGWHKRHQRRSEVRPHKAMRTAPSPLVVAYLWHPIPLTCVGPWGSCASRLKQHVGTSGCIARLRFGLFFCMTAPLFNSPCPVPPVLRRLLVLKLVSTPCPSTDPCVEAGFHHLFCIRTCIGSSLLLQCQKLTTLPLAVWGPRRGQRWFMPSKCPRNTSLRGRICKCNAMVPWWMSSCNPRSPPSDPQGASLMCFRMC